MVNLRIYGHSPFKVALIHGGPGAPGSLAPVARELSPEVGVLEPLQTASSVDGQIEELHELMMQNADLPIILVGWSWGAWLSYLFTARFPSLVRKLILVSSPPFEEKYALQIMETRLSRLRAGDREEVLSLLVRMNQTEAGAKNATLARFGKLISQADSCDPLPEEQCGLPVQFDIFEKVWTEAEIIRRSGQLLELGRQIRCPVVAIHGDYDPHPTPGVREPLSGVLRDFRFILLEKCGHTPWQEKFARDRFYEILKKELGLK